MQIDIDILIAWGAIIKKVKKGELVFSEGSSARYYFQIITGEIKIFNTNNDCKEYVQGGFHDGESFGEPALFIDEVYPSSAITAKDSVIIKLPRDNFMKILEEYPNLQLQLLKEFALRIFNKSITARDIVNNPPELRILGFLNSLKKNTDNPKTRILVPFTRQEIANLTGLRVETVIRTLMKMKEQNKVDIINHKLFY